MNIVIVLLGTYSALCTLAIGFLLYFRWEQETVLDRMNVTILRKNRVLSDIESATMKESYKL